MFSKKRIFLVILTLICIGLVVFFYQKSKKNNYVFGKVEKRSVTEIVSESGVVTSNGKIDIYSPSKGIISQIFVANGDLVKANQKLFTVKSTATYQERAEANAIYQAAKSALQQAENNRRNTIAVVDRVHDDVRDHDKDETFLQREARTTAEVANDNAYSALLAAQAQMNSAQANYYSTLNATVTTPISGVVSNISVVSGNGVSANNSLSTIPPVLIINTGGPTEIVVASGETDINKIQTGQEVDIKFDAVENKIYKGIVNRFDASGTLIQGVAKFNIYIVVNEPDENLKPGMNADVDITTRTIKDALTVPNTAIKPYQKGRAVRVLNNKKEIEYIPVKTGIKGKEFTQILEGLNEGQSIILSLSSEAVPNTGLF